MAFDYHKGSIIPIDIDGQPSMVFDFPPNWESKLTEAHQYQTDVLKSKNGKEQRRALRNKPRNEMGYSVLLNKSDVPKFEYLMWTGQVKVVSIPLWVHYHVLALPASSSVFNFETDASRLFQSGSKVLIAYPDRQSEVFTINFTSGKAVNLTTSPTQQWPAGSRVFPLRNFHLPTDVATRRPTSHVLETELRCRELVNSVPPIPHTQTADLMVGTDEALVRPVNWNTGMNVELEFEKLFTDAQVGPFDYEVPGNVGRRIRKGTVLTKQRNEVEWWEAFFDRMKGRQGQFICPTWQNDLPLQPVQGVGYDFEVPGDDLANYMPLNKVYTHVFVKKKDGTPAFYKINAITGDNALNITKIETDPWDETYPPTEALMVCFATMSRLAVDHLTVHWHTDRVAEIPITIATLEGEV